MKKRILSVLLAAVMVLLLIPVIAVPVSATPTSISIVSGSFEGYKGWLQKDQGGQTRYKQRGYTYTIQDSYPITNAFDGNTSTYAYTSSVVSYYPEIYINASGELVRDKTYDDVEVNVDFATYQASGLGKYYGVFSFTLEALAELDTVTIKAGPDSSNVDSNKAFDILYSPDGIHWAVAASYTNMKAAANWDSYANSVYTLNVSMAGVGARHIAFAVSNKSGQETGGLWLFEIAATGTVVSAPSVSITGGSFEAYKAFLSGSSSGRRAESQPLRDSNPITYAYDGNTSSYANSPSHNDYFPAIYLNATNELVRDSSHDDDGTDVNINDYLASGIGKYYGVYKFTLDDTVALKTVTIQAGLDGDNVDTNKSFDILYSPNGINWYVAASYQGMQAQSRWTSVEDGIATLEVWMGNNVAKYVGFAVSGTSGRVTGGTWVFEIAITGTSAAAPTVIEVGTEKGLRAAFSAYGTNPSMTIRLAADITMSSQSSLGGIAGTFDGGNHTIYNFTGGKYFCYPLHNCVIENLIFSNLTEPDGSSFTVSNQKTLFGDNATSSEIMEGETSIIRNVTNNRSLLGSGNTNGAFFATLTIAGKVRFENCVNNGDYIQNGGAGSANYNHKIGGFVGSMATGTVEFVNCVNNGDITASQAGGFIGVYATGTTITLTNCTNTGTITGLANGTAYGHAGGLIGAMNNRGKVTSTTTVTLTGCTNTGDILLQNTDNNTQAGAFGGLIGHAGGVDEGNASAYRITFDNCAVLNCTIDGLDTDTYTQSGIYAASFLGKVSPQGTGHTIIAKNCYVSNVGISANSARRFLGVGSYNVELPPKTINSVAVELNELDAAGDVTDWNGSANSNSKREYSATDYFTQTDEDMITGGTAGFVQDNGDEGAGALPSKVRFASTLDDADIGSLELVGYQVVASYDGGASVHGWTKTTKFVYTSLNENLPDGSSPSTKTANQIHAGDDYIFAITVENIPSYIGDVTFIVTPFVVKNDGTILFGKKGSTVISFGEANDTEIKLMSYNVKDGAYGTGSQSPNQRKVGLAKTIALKNPEIVCLQECDALSASSLASSCASNGTRTYTVYQPAGRTTALMYDATLYTALATGYADITVPKAEGDGYTRSGVWAKLKRIEDNAVFYVVSAHFDLNKPGTSADMLIDYINANFQEGIPTIILGDLNANEARWVNIAQMKNAGYTNANTDYTDFLSDNGIKGYDPYTWTSCVGETTAADNGLDPTFQKSGWIIDWCYYTGNVLTSSKYQTVTDTVYWSYSYESMSFSSSGSCTANPSDHYPIYVEMAFTYGVSAS